MEDLILSIENRDETMTQGFTKRTGHTDALYPRRIRPMRGIRVYRPVVQWCMVWPVEIPGKHTGALLLPDPCIARRQHDIERTGPRLHGTT